MSIDTLGLREQKKRETRQAISHHATQLFLVHGFDGTTIADIATTARVAKMTVTNYFPRKEDLALGHLEAFVSGLADAVAGRPAGESALGAVRRAYIEALERRDPMIGFTDRDFARMIADSPTLVARLRDLHDQREHALATHLTTEHAANAKRAGAFEHVGAAEHAGGIKGIGDRKLVESAKRAGAGAGAGAGVGNRGAIDGPGRGGVVGEELIARAVAAQLAAADRLLFRELQSRVLAGQSADEIATALTETAHHVFDLLELAVGTYAIR
ncbi:TetR/AcrR family transcriptional regulator [Nonomuraea purpurea]|uniref:TetR/AcrR family transcriptional regulator n=1 Tax=Nonomuraea purpurea TaxID=1849276 RepID=A0ABV8GMC8_9ACTN